MKKKINNVSVLLFLLCVLLLSFDGYYFFIRQEVGVDYYLDKFLFKPKPKDNILELNIYKDLCEEYGHLNKKLSETKIVFVGDSLTKRFNIHEFSDNNKIINRGIFFDTTQGLLDRLETNVNNIAIDKLFLMIGYNDLKFRTNREILSNIKEILNNLKARQVYLQSLLPVSSDRKGINERIININKELKRIVNGDDIEYIDLHSQFKTDDNYINPKLTRDGIHPNYLGYQLWFSCIKPLL